MWNLLASWNLALWMCLLSMVVWRKTLTPRPYFWTMYNFILNLIQMKILPFKGTILFKPKQMCKYIFNYFYCWMRIIECLIIMQFHTWKSPTFACTRLTCLVRLVLNFVKKLHFSHEKIDLFVILCLVFL